MGDEPDPDDATQAEGIRNEVPVERQLTGDRRIVRFAVGRTHGKGWRLDKYLHAILPTISRSLLRRWLNAGHCTIDGAVAGERDKLRPGNRVELRAPLTAAGAVEPPALPPLRLLHQDPGFLVVDKPAGQLAHQAGRTLTGTLVNQVQDWLEAHGRDPQQARLVNRIDRDTSGIVLVSLDLENHLRLSQSLDAGDLHKEYRAICHGVPVPESGSWLDPIAEPDDDSIAMRITADGKPSHTDYSVLARAGDRFALLAVLLHTGRQHQIRIHAAHHGHPLAGDWVYGTPCSDLPGQALHAAVLAFPHPLTGATLRIESPLPALLSDLWERLAEGGGLSTRAHSDEERSKLGLGQRRGPRRPAGLSDDEYVRLCAEQDG